MRKLKPDEILARRHEGNGPLAHPLATILEDVRSLYNVGSIFRTADAAGFREVLLAGITGTPENRGLRKTALGAELTMPWKR
jgi:tRNA G18 (ribose-2'-O)-methylase SpoU